MLVTKLIDKIADSRNRKEHYQSFLRKKNTKSVNKTELITQQPKTFDIVDIKPVITKFKADWEVGSDNPLNSDTKKVKTF